MIKKVFAIIIILIMVMNLAGCTGNGEKETAKKRYQAEFLQLFDTVTQIVGYANSKEEFENYANLIHDTLGEYHQLYDIYNDYDGINNIKTINDNAGIAPVKVDRRIIDLLIYSKDAYKKTNGQLNVALGSVLKIWHDYRTQGIEDFENAELPPMEQLQAAANHANINDVIINEEESTVFLKDPEMRLDVGGIAKGYAAEQAAKIAMKNGMSSCLLSVGGNIRSFGTKGDTRELWNVGIQNPDKSSEKTTLLSVSITDLSLVTSGVYERFYTVDGKNYHHIIDPETLYPAEYFQAVSIITPDSGLADVLSTAVFNMPFKQGLELIEGLDNTEALWVMKDGSLKYSTGFEQFIKK